MHNCATGETIHVGHFGEMSLTVFEAFDGTGSRLTLRLPDGDIQLTKYVWAQFAPREAPDGRLYYGHTLEQVMASGRDILGERALAEGELGWSTVEGVLPPLTDGAYAVLGSHVGWSGITVEPNGDLRAQRNHRELEPRYLFRPCELDAELGALMPVQLLLDEGMPILLSVHRGGARTLELMHFIEPGDAGKDPMVWTRALVYDNDSMEVQSARLSIGGLDLLTEGEISCEVSAEMFWDTFAGTVLYWRRYRDAFARLRLPDQKLQRAVYGCLGTMAVTYSADHPHYGHEYYGWEIHDHFPPTSITAIEACASLGHTAYARRMLEHQLAYAIDDAGRFFYRQGNGCMNGAAASEYGQLLWLVERYEQTLSPGGALVKEFEGKFRAVGDMLIRNRLPSVAQPDLRLIRMCAEADTNGRIYDYIQNSLWAVRGLSALAEMLERHALDGSVYRAEAQALHDDVLEAVARTRVDTRFGPLPPFQLDYTATPLTLSNCRDTFEPVSDAAHAGYLSMNNFREPIMDGQDYVENVYANYRYYLEMLASRCLKPEEEQAIVSLREQLGGELMGMTRFMDRLDDWPVYNYARYLLETGRLDKYLLLLYAHTELHGIPELMIYYEQAGLQGSVIAPDCVPSLLTTPLMVSWMFAFEPVQYSALQLLRGVPKRWFIEGFSAEGLCTRWGAVSVSSKEEDGKAVVRIALPEIPSTVPIYVRRPDGTQLQLEPGRREVCLRFAV